MLRAAIVGAGLMGRWHAQAIARAGGSLVAVVDRDLNAAKTLAGCSVGMGRVFKQGNHVEVMSFATLEEALSAGIALDVVHICTPLNTHTELTTDALNHGMHVIVEKPLAPTVAQVEQLIELAHAKKLLLCPVYQFLFQRSVRQALGNIDRLGALKRVEATIYSAGGAGETGAALDQIVYDILPHPLSLIEEVLRKIPSVGEISLGSVAWEVIKSSEGEFQAIGSVSGVIFSICISMNARPTRNTLELVGSRETFSLDLFHDFGTRLQGSVSRLRKIVNPFDGAVRTLFGGSVNLLRRAVAREQAYPGLRRLIVECYQAIEQELPSPIASSSIREIARTQESLSLHVLHKASTSKVRKVSGRL